MPVFDYYKIYGSYSTTELLKIVGQPSLYQHAAVEAATRLLREREINDLDRAEAQDAIVIAEARERTPDLVSKAGIAVAGALRYLFTPSPYFDIRKWNYWLCIGLILYNVFGLISNVRYLLLMIGCKNCTLSIVELFTLCNIIYMPVMISFLMFQKKWGWIMLLAYCCYEMIGSVFLFFSYWKYWQDKLPLTVVVIVLFAFLLRFLAKPRIVIFFKGSYTLYKRTITVTVACCMLIWLWFVFQA